MRNGSLEANANGDSLPDQWSRRSFTTGDGWDCTTAHGPGCSVKLSGMGKLGKSIYEKTTLTGDAGYQFALSFWYKANNVPGLVPFNAVQVKVYYTDRTTGEFWATIPAGTADWTQVTQTISAVSPYKMVTVTAYYPLLGGTVWYDDISLNVTPP